MATVRGGDIRQFKLNGKEYDIPTGASLEFTLPGFNNAFEAAGNGKMYGTQTRILAQVTGIEVVCNNANNDNEDLQALRDAGEEVPLNVTLADGSAWVGTVGIFDYTYKTDNGRASFSLAGSTLEQV